MKRFILLLLSITTLTSCAQKATTPEEWLAQNLVVLEKNGTYNFTELGEIIGDSRIVALGESSHGLAEFFSLKSQLIHYLHKEKGFEVLAMEGGLGDINLGYSTIDTLSAKQLKDNTLFPNFRPKEIDPLVAYIKATKDTKNPLLYTGFDTQISTSYFLKNLQKILEPYNADLSAELLPILGTQWSISEKARENDSLGYYETRDQFMKTASSARKTLLDNRNTIQENFIISDFQFKIMERTLVMFKKAVDLKYEENYLSYELRDQLMAENLVWLMEEIYPDKKVIIWAHNAHTENGTSEGYTFKMMGHYLKEKFKENYYSLGLFAYKGEAYQQWTRSIMPFENSETTSIEQRLTQTVKKTTFLDLDNIEKSPNTQWLYEVVQGREFENGGAISFFPKKRFDGIITVYQSGAPSYDE